MNIIKGPCYAALYVSSILERSEYLLCASLYVSAWGYHFIVLLS
jgi:hypothetical protein